MNDLSQSTVLFVDDEVDLLEILENIIAGDVSKVFTTNQPIKALEIIKNNRVDLAVLDLSMPEMSGLDLLAEIKKISPQTHFIFLSGYGSREDIRKAMQLGVENFIDKPIDKNYVKLCIKQSLEKVAYERLLSEMLEFFVLPHLKIDMSSFHKLGFEEKEKALKAALGVAKLKVMNKQATK